MIYKKYILPFIPNTVNGDWVYLGKPIQTPPTYDSDGNVITPTVWADGHKVDVMWKGEPNPEWEQYVVKPSKHEHWFMGKEKLWEKCNP